MVVVAHLCGRREPIPEKNAKGTRYEMSETEKLNFAAVVVDVDGKNRENACSRFVGSQTEGRKGELMNETGAGGGRDQCYRRWHVTAPVSQQARRTGPSRLRSLLNDRASWVWPIPACEDKRV